jgi:hypothetical protein
VHSTNDIMLCGAQLVLKLTGKTECVCIQRHRLPRCAKCVHVTAAVMVLDSKRQ